MCGRYYVDDDTAREIEKLVRQIDEKLKKEQKSGDIYPSQLAPVIVEEGGSLKTIPKQWGFHGFKGTGVIFNARSETVLEKKMFRESVLRNRCVVPAKHFYEWDSHKQKFTFFQRGKRVLYMAGCYQSYAEGDRFVILTTNANKSMQEIHNRMPLILEEDEINGWLLDEGKMRELLKKEPCLLEKSTEYEQQTLRF